MLALYCQKVRVRVNDSNSMWLCAVNDKTHKIHASFSFVKSWYVIFRSFSLAGYNAVDFIGKSADFMVHFTYYDPLERSVFALAVYFVSFCSFLFSILIVLLCSFLLLLFATLQMICHFSVRSFPILAGIVVVAKVRCAVQISVISTFSQFNSILNK